jgi:hypothetical protein
MSEIIRIDMLPARRGDCLWLEYGDPQSPHKLIIDGGTTGTYKAIRKRLRALPIEQRHFELLVVTHIDADHIEGVLKLLNDQEIGVSFDDIWFNGWRHLPESDIEDFGPVQGEKLTKRLDMPDLQWNMYFGGRTVSLPEIGQLPSRILPGGMTLTLLSPAQQQLAELRPVWERECKKHGLDPLEEPAEPPEPPPGLEVLGPFDIDQLADTPFECDGSKPNGSSIVVLSEYAGRRFLLAGDAYSDVLLEGIKRLVGPEENDILQLDAFKVPHHGSKANIDHEILKKIASTRYLFSTNGARFKHPDKEAVARIIKYGGEAPELIFNYRTDYNRIWDDDGLKEKYQYSVSYPETNKTGMTIDL